MDIDIQQENLTLVNILIQGVQIKDLGEYLILVSECGKLEVVEYLNSILSVKVYSFTKLVFRPINV